VDSNETSKVNRGTVKSRIEKLEPGIVQRSSPNRRELTTRIPILLGISVDGSFHKYLTET
jgi:hypothetical protein